jgi:hypothetical protein
VYGVPLTVYVTVAVDLPVLSGPATPESVPVTFSGFFTSTAEF